MERSWNPWRQFRLRRLAKNIRQPIAGLVLALPGDDPTLEYTSFGIGCFHFGAKVESFDGDAAAHVEAVETWLKSADDVTNVVVDDPRISWFETDLPFGLSEGGQPLPAIRRLRIEFDLRLQEDERDRHDPWRAHREPLDAHVSIRQGPAVPVAFVVPRTDPEQPTWAVSEVWHALRDRVPPDVPFFLDLRGPSPAPVAGFLVPLPEPSVSETPPGAFEYERIQLGVSHHPWCVFGYNPDHYDLKSAEHALFESLEIPAGLFYEVAGSTTRLQLEWNQLERQRNALLDRKRATGLFGHIRRNWGEAALLRELAISLTGFEANVEADQRVFNERRKELEELSLTPFLVEEIDESLRTEYQFNTEQIARPLDLFEKRRMNRTQILAVVMSAILAAVIGATSALWVAGSDQPPTVTVTVVSPSSSTPSPSTPKSGGTTSKPQNRGAQTKPPSRAP